MRACSLSKVDCTAATATAHFVGVGKGREATAAAAAIEAVLNSSSGADGAFLVARADIRRRVSPCLHCRQAAYSE